MQIIILPPKICYNTQEVIIIQIIILPPKICYNTQEVIIIQLRVHTYNF